MNSSFRNVQICVYPAHSNAPRCGKLAFYADFMRFPVRYPPENRHKMGVQRPEKRQNGAVRRDKTILPCALEFSALAACTHARRSTGSAQTARNPRGATG